MPVTLKEAIEKKGSEKQEIIGNIIAELDYWIPIFIDKILIGDHAICLKEERGKPYWDEIQSLYPEFTFKGGSMTVSIKLATNKWENEQFYT